MPSSIGFNDWQIGFLFSAYPVCQLVAGPILGRLSDRYGRSPLLIFSQAGTALSFLILGLSRDFSVMLLARMLDGASGGNILVAQAYVADVTEPEHRARGMGLIGMAFGLGFVLGPLLGGLLLWSCRCRRVAAAAAVPGGRGLFDAGVGARSLPASRVAAASRTARETRLAPELAGNRRHRRASRDRPAGPDRVPRRCWPSRRSRGRLRCFLRRRLHWDAQTAAFAFAGLGFLSAIVQGGLIRRLVPRFGEARLIVVGLILAACGFAGLSQVSSVTGLIGALVLLGVGQGLLSPSVSGLLSRITPMDEQGAVFGTLTSAQTLARMISYSAANFLLGRVSTAAPYWGAFGVDLVALAVVGTWFETAPQGIRISFRRVSGLGRSRSR